MHNMIETLKISACLMVKNEEEMLPGCLDSIKDFVDEIIIVDTGSDDRTVEIAESYGAKVYHHPWENDFSKHRNQSISYATGDWFLMIDADERLQELNSTPQEIKSRLAGLDSKVHAVLITMRDFNKGGELKLSWKVSKLFRNGIGVKYEGIVHNQPVVQGKMVDSDLIINHYGYDLSKEKMEKKFDRSNALLQMRIEEDPEDYEAYFYLANMYSANSLFRDGIEYGKKSLRYLPDSSKNRSVYLKLHYNIGACYLRLEEFELAKEWFNRGLSYLPDDTDLHYGLIILGINTDNSDIVKKHSIAFLSNIDEFRDHPEKTGSRFMYHLDISHKKSMILNYCNVLLSENDLGLVEKTLEDYSEYLSENQFALEMLEKISFHRRYDLLIKYSIVVFRNNQNDLSVLQFILKDIANENVATEQIKTVFLELFRDQDDFNFVTNLINLAIQSNNAEVAQQILGQFKNGELQDDHKIASLSIIQIYKGSKGSVIENTSRLIRNGFANQNYYITIIPYLYKTGDFGLLQSAIEIILPKFEDFEKIPDIILLALARTLLNNEDMEFFVQVVQVISKRLNGINNYTINSISDLGTLFSEISELYLKEERKQLAEFALDIAFSLTEEPKYLEKQGKIAFTRGDFARSLELYTGALDRNFKDPEMIKNMGVIFEKYGDESGKKQCDKILTQL